MENLEKNENCFKKWKKKRIKTRIFRNSKFFFQICGKKIFNYLCKKKSDT